jgi:nuclear pore complex protein Nup133
VSGNLCVTQANIKYKFLLSTGASGITAGDLEHHISSVLSPNTTNVGNLTMYELDPEEIYVENKDSVNKLKAALIYHLKRNNTMCQSVLKELLTSATDLNKKKVDSILDR